jgi:hypothetical protein
VGYWDFALECRRGEEVKTATATVEVVPPPNMRLAFFGADNASTAGIPVRMRSGSWDSTLATSADGSLTLPLSPTLRSRLSGLIAVETGIGHFIPSKGDLTVSEASAGIINAVLYPAKWNHTCGTYAGTEVPLSFHKAFVPAGDGNWFYQIPNRWLWPQFPIRLTYNEESPYVAISPSGKEKIWAEVAEMEARWCEDLFVSATEAEVLAEGGIRIQIDPNHPVIANAGAALGSSGGVHLKWGVTTFRNESILGLLPHELMHVLAFGHVCIWETVMFSGCANNVKDEPTPEDMAYAKVYYAGRKLELAKNARFGMDEAIRGEQEILLGIPGGLFSPSVNQSALMGGSPTSFLINEH